MKPYRIHERRNRWNFVNMATCSCRLRREDYQVFRETCRAKGYTAHHVLRLLIAAYLINSEQPITEHLKSDLKAESEKSRYYKALPENLNI